MAVNMVGGVPRTLIICVFLHVHNAPVKKELKLFNNFVEI